MRVARNYVRGELSLSSHHPTYTHDLKTLWIGPEMEPGYICSS